MISRAGRYGFPAGTTMMFIQAAAPMGWTRVNVGDDALLRIVGTATPSTGGSNGFVAAFNSQTVTTVANSTGTGTTGTGTTGSSSLTIAMLASHQHSDGTAVSNLLTNPCGNQIGGGASATATSAATGSGATHNHSVPGLSVPALTIPSLAVNYTGSIKYVDALVARKN